MICIFKLKIPESKQIKYKLPGNDIVEPYFVQKSQNWWKGFHGVQCSKWKTNRKRAFQHNVHENFRRNTIYFSPSLQYWSWFIVFGTPDVLKLCFTYDTF